MKKLFALTTILILTFITGCVETKVYLGREEPEDNQEIRYGAINPTEIPAGITWGTFRSFINNNFDEVDLAIDTLDRGLADMLDSLASHWSAIQLRLLKSDSTVFATQHDLVTGLAGKQDTFSLKTVNGQSLKGTGDITIEGGTGGTGTVTSIGLTAPTGFTVTNSPVTTNGSIILAFTEGYSLPQTADQLNWGSAYTWVNNNGATVVSALSDLANLIIRTDSIVDAISDTVDINETIVDSILLRTDQIFAFGAGSGNPSDTAIFTGTGFPVLGSFRTGIDTVLVTEVVGQFWDKNTSDTLAVQIMYADSLGQESFTTLWSSPAGINSDGMTSTSFANPKIPPKKWVWSRVAHAGPGRKPTMVVVQLNGIKIKAY